MKLLSHKTYVIVTGSLLFAFGFLGIAFKSYFSISISYLIISLALGFWGIVVYFGGNRE